MADRWNVRAMRRDLDLLGWNQSDLARRAKLSPATVTRFFSGDYQTARVAKKLAKALGRTTADYLVDKVA